VKVALNLAFLAPGEQGGLETYARELTRALAARGDVELVLLLNRLLAREREWGELGEPVVLPVDPRRRIEWVLADQVQAPRAAARRRADVLHSLASTAPAAGPFRRVVTVHDLNYLVHPDTHFGVLTLGMRVLVPLAVRRSHRTIAPSESTRRDLVERLGADPARVDVVPEGVGQAPAPPGELPAGIDGDRPLVLSVSAKRPHKNLARLIAALALVPPEERPLLVLPGYPTPHEAELREQAERAGVAGDVLFLGWVSAGELEALHRAAAFTVFPSLYEGFGLPVLEAMARGVPVATSERGSLREVAGDAALLFDPEDERSIADAMRRLLRDGELRERLARAGEERAARFSWEAAAEATLATYRRALAE
jgi:glycosyltransferase involved in cell wall biosynthesis